MRNQPIDLLINNAGIFLDRPPHDTPTSWETFAQTLKTNTYAPWALTEMLKPMIAQSSLRLVCTISSAYGSLTQTSQEGFYAYRASKTAINSIMHGLADAYQDLGIKIIIMSPGWVQTDMTQGGNAPLTVSESVGNMCQTLSNHHLLTSGGFYSHNGNVMPW